MDWQSTECIEHIKEEHHVCVSGGLCISACEVYQLVYSVHLDSAQGTKNIKRGWAYGWLVCAVS